MSLEWKAREFLSQFIRRLNSFVIWFLFRFIFMLHLSFVLLRINFDDFFPFAEQTNKTFRVSFWNIIIVMSGRNNVCVTGHLPGQKISFQLLVIICSMTWQICCTMAVCTLQPSFHQSECTIVVRWAQRQSERHTQFIRNFTRHKTKLGY